MSVLLISFSPRASKLQSKESKKRLTKDYDWYNSFKANLSWGRASDSWRPGKFWIEDICMWYTKGWRVIQWKRSLPSTLTLGHPVSQLGPFQRYVTVPTGSCDFCVWDTLLRTLYRRLTAAVPAALWSASIYKQGDLLVAWSEQATAQSPVVIRDIKSVLSGPLLIPLPLTHTPKLHILSSCCVLCPGKQSFTTPLPG